jgi:hypothetical protein
MLVRAGHHQAFRIAETFIFSERSRLCIWRITQEKHKSPRCTVRGYFKTTTATTTTKVTAPKSESIMTEIATLEFLGRLKTFCSHLPGLNDSASSKSLSDLKQYIEDPWYIVAAVSFSASNRPDGVPKVLEFVLRELDEAISTSATSVDLKEKEILELRQRVVMRLREALFKAGLISGYSRVSQVIRFSMRRPSAKIIPGIVHRPSRL